MAVVVSEKQVLSELIQLYQELPCLWDNRTVLYSNKDARDQAYDMLLEKYIELEPKATLAEVKRRIDNMRCCFRREHKKVLLSRENNEIPVYIPQLWYYDQMSFLAEVMEFHNLRPTKREIVDSCDDEDTKINMKKKRKSAEPSMYLKDFHGSEDGDFREDNSILRFVNVREDNDNIDDTEIVNQCNSECEAFGTTVGLQLKQLDPLQRIFAEKLISDVIFQARLHKLEASSSVNC